MRVVDPDSALELVESYVARSGRRSASAEEIASSLDIDVCQVRCALKELECDGLLDDSSEDDY